MDKDWIDPKYSAREDELTRINPVAPTPSPWPGPGTTPHEYHPDLMAMGDCSVCGHTYDSHFPATPSPAPDIAGLVDRAELHALNLNRHNEYFPTAFALRELATALQRVAQERDDKHSLADRLKIEAQIHSGEARTANATIYEIYQVISGATGEPGNWHGAEPVRAYVEAAEARLSSARDEGLEMAAAIAETHPKHRPGGWSGDPTCYAIAAAIRALKGTKP